MNATATTAQDYRTRLHLMLKFIIDHHATDLHLVAGSPPLVRLNTQLQPLGKEVLTPKDTEEYARVLMSERRFKRFLEDLDQDFSYSIGDLMFRTNCCFQRGTIAIAMRHNRNDILEFEKLNLPNVVRQIAQNHRGMILVTGVTGSGKSTTMAAMLRHILRQRKCHVVTIEDPIEFIYPNESGVVTQREVGEDCESFLMALRHALRQDPDVILIGEMRDGETIRTALAAAETGHLVFSTLHTLEAQTTIERILSFFPGHEQAQIRQELANNLVGVISQRLVARSDRPGIVPVLEVMVGTSTVQKCILENRIKDIRQAIQNQEDGMQTFNQHLLELIKKGWISVETAMANSGNPAALRRMLSGGMSGGDSKGLVGM